MAKDLTEVAVYTTPITVPEGDDPRSHAAEDVEGIAQALANRTEWMRGFVVRAILEDDASRSIFTVPIQGDSAEARQPTLRALVGPHDHPGKPLNYWREFLQACNVTTGNSLRSGVYIGDGVQGFIGIVVNAQWQEHIGANGEWDQLDASKPSYFLFINDAGNLQFSKKAAGAPNWTAWDSTTDCIIQVPSLTVGDTIQTQGLQVNTLLLSLGPITCSEDYNYTGTKTRTTPIRISSMLGPVLVDGETGYVKQEETNPSHKVSCPINLPVGANLQSARIRHVQATTTGDRLSIMKRTNQGSGTLTVTEVGFAVANSTITGSPTDKITTISSINYTVAAGDELFFQWRIMDDGSMDALTNNEIRAGDMTWSESKITYQ